MSTIATSLPDKVASSSGRYSACIVQQGERFPGLVNALENPADFGDYDPAQFDEGHLVIIQNLLEPPQLSSGNIAVAVTTFSSLP